jgi:hypothetical protein
VAPIDERSEPSFCHVVELPEERRFLQRPPDGNDQPSSAIHRPSHFTDCGRLVRKELQPLVTEDKVESLSITERQGARVSLAPVDPWFCRARDSEHMRTHVDTDNLAGACQPFHREARDDASPAGDVEHPIPRSESGAVEDDFRKGLEERAHEPPLVHFREVRRVHRVGR